MTDYTTIWSLVNPCGVPWHRVPAWVWMWLIAGLCFFCTKALLLWKAGSRDWSFLLLWPGMDLRAFQRCSAPNHEPTQWARRGMLNVAVGALVCWLGSMMESAFAATWCCMVGFILMLHCGVFTLLAAFWRSMGRDVKPIMNSPLLARSVTELWGERWNLAFSDAALPLIARPVNRRWGRAWAVMAVFTVSGLLHDLVISVPAGAGYGGPTVYFLLQGLMVLWERKCWLTSESLWRVRTMLTALLPLPLLFHEPAVMGVMHPFFQTLHLLP